VYSEETADRVCDLIATGHNLHQIEAMRATEPDLPARRHGQMTSRRWDLSLVVVDGQGFRIMPTKAMCRLIAGNPKR
jgi:hypothetical protein